VRVGGKGWVQPRVCDLVTTQARPVIVPRQFLMKCQPIGFLIGHIPHSGAPVPGMWADKNADKIARYIIQYCG
jgi:hypothetical protein